MSYFSDLYAGLRYPVADNGDSGLRNSQLGAIHAVASHSTLYREPAIVVMPTGSGKTAVLVMSPFVLRAKRVLAITTSRLVRSQIAAEFEDLETLKQLGVLAPDAGNPKTYELTGRIGSDAEWEALRDFDVVVATPHSVSPGIKAIPNPPADLFDLLLVDEAHHTPAKIWNSLLEAFPGARRILATATPFRRDNQEIKGRLAYAYPIRQAYEDKVFGKITYMPVVVPAGVNPDVAIAEGAERILNEDRSHGYKHCVMVRTDSKRRANELKKVYQEGTALKMPVIHSDLTYSYVKRTIKKLRQGELDGVICVDMMSEGFDFPQLKIAAIHAPHRSLAATLQFIGRFARTNSPDVGDAKFLAIPSDIQIEARKLYEEKSVWQEMIVELSEKKIEDQQRLREAIESFEKPEVEDFKAEDVSLYALWPYNHTKIYQVGGAVDVDMGAEISLPKPFEVVYQQRSKTLSAVIMISNEKQRPRWTTLQVFSRSEYDLFVVFFHKALKLLFINASCRNDSIYEYVATQFTGGSHKILPLWKVNRVLRGLQNADFFNVGMKNRVLNDKTESYKIITGTRAQLALSQSDGRLYHRGHVFGKGQCKGEDATLGYSSASKVWRNETTQIPELIEWFNEIAGHLSREGQPAPEAGLKYLTVGEEISKIPGPVIATGWDPIIYDEHTTVSYPSGAQGHITEHLSDLDLSIDGENSGPESIRVIIQAQAAKFEIDFSFTKNRYFEPAKAGQTPFLVHQGNEASDLIDFLNNNPLHFYCADFSRFRAAELFRANVDLVPYDGARATAINWNGENVNIQKEVWKENENPDGKTSLHDFLRGYLDQDRFDVVIYDHRTGEVADFICVGEAASRIEITLYHVKAAGGRPENERVSDVYEVCGQVVKSMIWLNNETTLLDVIDKRIRAGSSFVKGDFDKLKKLFVAGQSKGFRYGIGLVQPGISVGGMTAKVGNVLAAAEDFIVRGNVERMELLASA